MSCAEERLKKRNQKRKFPKKYYKVYTKSDGSRAWAGLKDLKATAQYPAAFCKAIYKCWLVDFSSQPQGSWSILCSASPWSAQSLGRLRVARTGCFRCNSRWTKYISSEFQKLFILFRSFILLRCLLYSGCFIQFAFLLSWFSCRKMPLATGREYKRAITYIKRAIKYTRATGWECNKEIQIVI